MSTENKVAIRLIAGPADGLAFSVPAQKLPLFVTVGPHARYERIAGEGDVIHYRLSAEESWRH